MVFRGVTITNSVDGVSYDGLFQERNLTGTVVPGVTITISGSFHQGDTVNSYYTCHGSIEAGSASNSTSYYTVYPGTDQAFAVSLTVPANAQSASVTIQDGDWNGVRIIGSFIVPVEKLAHSNSYRNR